MSVNQQNLTAVEDSEPENCSRVRPTSLFPGSRTPSIRDENQPSNEIRIGNAIDFYDLDSLLALNKDDSCFTSVSSNSTLDLFHNDGGRSSPSATIGRFDWFSEVILSPDILSVDSNQERCTSGQPFDVQMVCTHSPHMTQKTGSSASSQATPSLSSHLWNWESVLIDYFFHEVVPLYSLFDSPINPLRRMIELVWQSSEPVYHTLKSMAALCLGGDFPHLSTVAARERAEALVCIDKLQSFGGREELLLSCIMIGHTSTWYRSDDLSLGSYSRCQQILEDWSREDNGSADRAFFWDVFSFWRMLLAFTTEELPQLGSAAPNLIGPRSTVQCSLPHPWTGTATDIIKVLSDVGTLIYSLRKRLRGVTFMTAADIHYMEEAISKARRLESILLNYQPVDMTTVLDPGDIKTPKEHLREIDKAYRALALLQLYRVFPDLLSQRYQPWEDDDLLRPRACSKEPSARECDTWLTHLAVYVIAILKEIPFESRTRSVQPFFFVAVATELRLDHNNDLHGSDQPFPLVSAQAAQARRFIRSRISAYKHMLPIKKTQMFYDVVQQLWSDLDSKKAHVYWLDILSDRGLETIMG